MEHKLESNLVISLWNSWEILHGVDWLESSWRRRWWPFRGLIIKSHLFRPFNICTKILSKNISLFLQRLFHLSSGQRTRKGWRPEVWLGHESVAKTAIPSTHQSWRDEKNYKCEWNFCKFKKSFQPAQFRAFAGSRQRSLLLLFLCVNLQPNSEHSPLTSIREAFKSTLSSYYSLDIFQVPEF